MLILSCKQEQCRMEMAEKTGKVFGNEAAVCKLWQAVSSMSNLETHDLNQYAESARKLKTLTTYSPHPDKVVKETEKNREGVAEG